MLEITLVVLHWFYLEWLLSVTSHACEFCEIVVSASLRVSG